MIMSLQSQNRLKLIIPKSISKSERILKTCSRCRQHKIKCDAFETNPNPCTRCLKNNVNCKLEILHKPNGRVRTLDIVERLSCEVSDLKVLMTDLIQRRNDLVELLIERGRQIEEEASSQCQKQQQQQPQPQPQPQVQMQVSSGRQSCTPPVSAMQSCLNTPCTSPQDTTDPFTQAEEETPHSSDTSKFSLSANTEAKPISISHKQAQSYFTNYERNFNKYLPIFPDEFFQSVNLIEFHKENELTFWCIILTSHLNHHDQASNYRVLSEHVKSLVVDKCWFHTPRSVYIISSLLILTTWPLPSHQRTKIADNLSVKFISLMKSLSYQFGLHKLEFISEFSHKTKINLSQEVNLNNRIRERIYKFVNINSNYWLINLGLSNNNCNGFNQDYILNKASNIDIHDASIISSSSDDHYIDCLLKVSMIQVKLNENMNALIGDSLEYGDDHTTMKLLPNQINTTKLINFNMFEIIIDDLRSTLARLQQRQQRQQQQEYEQSESYYTTSTSTDLSNLIQMSTAYTKLQLFIYSLSKSDITLQEYKVYVKKLVTCCMEISNLIESQQTNYLELPIYYKLPIELTLLTLLRVFKSPVLDTVEEYKVVKTCFNKIYTTVFKYENWQFMTTKLHRIIELFDHLSREFIVRQVIHDEEADEVQQSNAGQPAPPFLITKMKNYLVSSLQYEMIWLIYQHEHSSKENNIVPKQWSTRQWNSIGVYDNQLIEYLKLKESILQV
ncbi:SEF2 [Candida theae]|uniref:SEF2 n=1 Tax=Candida theae TaxID=1198502 RepID=A0AAD5BDY1_9ASCO|nr:SEF2 [Candida theae]KAI5957764.1 SEF2 [Candida theae]